MSAQAKIARSSRARSPRAVPGNQRGSALFLLLILSVVMATVLGGVFSYISTNAKSEKRSNVRLESTYAAEYAFEQAYHQLNTLIFSDTQNAPDISHTTSVTNLSTAPATEFSTSQGYTWNAFITVPIENGVPIDAFADFNPSTGVYKYLTAVEFTRTVPGMANPVRMRFQREWNYSLTPLFQYAIFYDRDLELFPGAQFVVGGKVHSNGTIYTGTTASILYKDQVTYVNGLTQGRYSPNDPRAASALNGDVTYTRGKSITTRQNPPGSTTANLADSNHNNDGPRELVEIPDVHSSDPTATERMYNKAGLKVIVNTSGAALSLPADSGITVPANGMVFLTKDGTQIPDTDPLATYLKGLIATGSTLSWDYKIQDYREGTTLVTTNVDVSAIAAAQKAGGLPDTLPTTAKWSGAAPLSGSKIDAKIQGKEIWNGILYVTDISNTKTHRAAVRLKNGQKLPDGTGSARKIAGLTVVTANAAYIIGDYNTGSGAVPVNGSGSALTADNHDSTYTPQPAAVMADAITILSKNWTTGGYDTQATLSKRDPVYTTINTALISGIVESTKGGTNPAYSGGVENYLRLLEDWSGQRLTYYGSMVNLYNSEQSTANWITTGTYYNAPARNWYFDTQFLNPNRLPPGTPVLRSLLRGQWAQIDDSGT